MCTLGERERARERESMRERFIPMFTIHYVDLVQKDLATKTFVPVSFSNGFLARRTGLKENSGGS